MTTADAVDEVRAWLRIVVDSDATETWVAVDDGRVVGMMVVGPNDLDQLYVAPGHQGRGIGRRLVDLAKAISPAGLTLYTFQINERARRFYARNGFRVDALGDGSANEEGQPDVRYVWRPSGDAVTP